MSFTPDSFTADSSTRDASGSLKPFADPAALLRIPVGLSSPLWGLFAGAAMSGAAWWWMTRWARPENLEAMFGAAAKFEAAVEPKVVDFAAPVLEAVEATAEAVTDTVVEAARETASQAPVLEALVEGPAAPKPVGGEAAPISPVLQVSGPEVAAGPAPTPPGPTPPKPKKTPPPKPASSDLAPPRP